MLKKLLKYEWKSVAGILTLLHGALILLTIVSRIFIPLFDVDYLSSLIPSTFTMIFIISLFALTIGSYFFLVIRYYKNMFTDQGYLMHTLPVKPYQLIWSKALTFFIWNTINFVISTLCLVVFFSGFSEQSILSIFAEFPAAIAELGTLIAGNTAVGIIILLLALIIFAFHSIFLVYCAITVGHIFHKHKVLLSVVFTITFHIGLQILNSIFMVIFLVKPLINLPNQQPDAGYFRLVFYGWILMYAILAAIFYFISNRIINKNLNLE